ncbi:TRPM8 channel-associated factor homolog [Anneissia japonica]|uniref:TRPM8 channel-associated factor homolog n=1 Tax=Anneissia japonica TaxID=1529436 RepID=UPI0014257E4E|nr:TRPM8 channel-associated factor homolog [Anneissia japonica]
MDPTTDQLFILNGVKKLTTKDSPPFECKLNGDSTFPLVRTKQDKVIVAAAFHGLGRIVVFGNKKFVTSENEDDDFNILVNNAFRWLTVRKSSRVGIWVPGCDTLQRRLSDAGFDVFDFLPASTTNVDVIFTDKIALNEAETEFVDSFVRNGGGLLVGANELSSLQESVNNFITGCGISLLSQVSEESSEYNVGVPEPSESLHYIFKEVGKQIDFKNSSPSKLLLYGEHTFGVVVREDGDGVVVAASHVGLGRAMHWGHNGILNKCREYGIETLIENTFRWMSRNKVAAKIGFLKPVKDQLKETVENLGLTVIRINIDDDFGDLDILVADSSHEYTQHQLDKFYSFLSTGGGLLTGGHNWITKNDSTSAIVKPAGIMISEKPARGKGYETANQKMQYILNVTLALKRFLQHADGEIELDETEQQSYRTSICQALEELPLTCKIVFNLAREYLQRIPVAIPTKKSPVDIWTQPVSASYAFIYSILALRLQPSDLQQLKLNGEVFPGEASSNIQPSSTTITIDATYDGLLRNFPSANKAVRRSTGLYAAPAEIINVTIPGEAIDSKLCVLIGCHTDNLEKKEQLHRFPRISRSFDLDSVTTQAANVFGGLIYITVPCDTKIGPISVTVDGACKSPQFFAGKTSLEEWQLSMENHNVPFCELISENIIITLPSSDALKHWEDAQAIMEIYERVVCSYAELSGIDVKRPREERFVLDVQISKGQMHAGYPIMGPITNSDKMISLDRVRNNNIWGPLHELGHQHQSNGWNPVGTKEATCNIYSVYASEEVMKIPREMAHGALKKEKRIQRVEDYVIEGSQYKNWNVWTCLETYLQLQEAFGWKFISDMLGQYNNPSFKSPKTNTEQLDVWMVLSSKLTGFNLGPFYKAWGWPVTDEALQSIETLPAWDDNPMIDRLNP